MHPVPWDVSQHCRSGTTSGALNAAALISSLCPKYVSVLSPVLLVYSGVVHLFVNMPASGALIDFCPALS